MPILWIVENWCRPLRKELNRKALHPRADHRCRFWLLKMNALSILFEVNAKLESASQMAEDLEREMANSLPAKRLAKEKSEISRQGSVRRSNADRVIGPRQESFEVGPAPGAYDVASTVVGKRVTGGKWGGNSRFSDKKDEDELGPGQYDPNQSFVKRKRPGVKIVAPTKKTLAAHMHAFELEEASRGVGPGKYSPSFFVTSEWCAVPKVSIRPKNKPDERLQQHLYEREELKAGQAPGAYEYWLRNDTPCSANVLQWHPNYAPKREQEVSPGPGSYDPDYAAVKEHVSEVRIAPSEAAINTNRSARSVASERSAFLQCAEGPGPGSYDAQYDSVQARAPSTVLKSHETKSLKIPARHEGDMLVLDPSDSYTKPRVRCSVVMKEASFLSQASTAVPDEVSSDIGAAYDADLSVLSTRPRTLSFSMDGQAKRPEMKQSDKLGPGYYQLKYDAIEAKSPASRVLHSNSKRFQQDMPASFHSSTCKIILDTDRCDQYLRSSIGVPDIARFSARPESIPGQIMSAFTGEKDYDTLHAARALWTHTPGVNIRKESGRKEFVVDKDSNPLLGPGKYDVDDSLLHPRAQSAFISNTVDGDHEDDHNGDVLVLEPTTADKLIRKRVPALVNMEKAAGRIEPKKEPTPEALDYVTDARDRATPGEPIPGVRGLKFDGQVGRVEPKAATEGAHLFGKYNVDYSQVEVQAQAVDFSRGTGRRVEGEEGAEGKQDGDVLVLDTHNAHEFLRHSSKLVLDISKQTSRPDAVAGQHISAFTGEEEYDTLHAARTLWTHTPGVNIRKESGRKEFVDKDSNPLLGPGKYDVDDSLLHPRTQSAFISNTVDGDHEDDHDGDVLVLEPTTADKLIRKRVPALVNMEKAAGRIEPKKEPTPEALDYVTDARDRATPGEPIPGVRGLKFDGQVGRVEPKAATEGAHLFGKYNVDYSQVEVQAQAVDFSRGTGRRVEGEEGAEGKQDGDVLVLQPSRAHEYLQSSRKLVLDMSKQTSRPDEVAGQIVSAFIGEEDYEAAEAQRALYTHTPTVDFGNASARRDCDGSKDANPKVGPGTYDVDDALLHPRVKSVFISTNITYDPDIDFEGDVLDLEAGGADKLVRKRIPAPVNMAKAQGRRELETQERKPEALDYVPDIRDRVKPGEPIPGVPSLPFDAQIGRTDLSILSRGDGAHLQGIYHADYALVEKRAPAVEFGKACARVVVGEEDHDQVQDGDVLELEPQRALEYLQRSKLVVDIAKQTGRPQELPGQLLSACDPETEYASDLTAVLPHTPVVSFDKIVGRREEKEDEDAAKLGPGRYHVKDELTHPRAPSAVISQPPPVFEDAELHERHDGDVLILNPAEADKLTRPSIPAFTNVFQKPALETEWATKTRKLADPHTGELVALPSIRKRFDWHRLSELISKWNRPDVYEIEEADRLTRARIYQESAVDFKTQKGHTVVKVDLGAKIDWDPEGKNVLPSFQHIFTGGQVDKAKGIHAGDTLVMITTPNGKKADLRRWAFPRPPPTHSKPPPKNTSRVVSQLGPWRECAVDVAAPADCTFEAPGSTFFFHVGTRKRTWRFEQWSLKSYMLELLQETLAELGYPLTLHVRRRQSHCIVSVPIRGVDDSLIGAYDPKFELVEAAPIGIPDFVAVSGRDLSLDAKSKYELFQSNMYYHALRTTPREVLISDKELEAQHAEQRAHQRSAHEERVRALIQRQRSEHALELEAIPAAAARARPSAEGQDADTRAAQQEDLFAVLMQESVLGDEEARREALIDELNKRQAAERKQLRALVRAEEQHLREAQLRERTLLVDAKEVKEQVLQVAYTQRLQVDAAERLRETERQRRRRFAREPGAGLQHTAEYSHGAPQAAQRWLDTGKKTHSTLDSRGLSDAHVANWKAHTEYNGGLRAQDQIVKWFWQLLESWRPSRRAALLQLCTGTAAAPKGGFGYLSGHDIQRPDGAHKFSLRKLAADRQQQYQQQDGKRVLLPRAFAPLNRLYLPEYRSKHELAAGLEQGIDLMLNGKTAPSPTAAAPTAESTLLRPLQSQQIEAPSNHIFTIYE